MRRVREVLHQYALSRAAIVHCLSLNDTAEEIGAHPRAVDATVFASCGKNKSAFLARAASLSLRHNYDLVIVGLLGIAPAAYWLKLSKLIKSYMLLLHGVEAWAPLPLIERAAARNADTIVSTTNYTAQVFGKNNRIDPSRHRVIPLCIAETKSAVEARPVAPPSPASEFTLLAVGRLDGSEREKGIDVAIEAMPHILSAVPACRFVIVGDGTDRRRLQALAEKLGVGGRVRLLGSVEDSVLQELYRQCNVMVLPSRQEGFGIVFLEAMSHSKPCIGSTEGGIPEVVVDGTTGFLVPFGDAEALTASVVRLASDSDLARNMGAAGLQRVLERYCFDSFCQRLSGLLDDAISPRRGQPTNRPLWINHSLNPEMRPEWPEAE